MHVCVCVGVGGVRLSSIPTNYTERLSLPVPKSGSDTLSMPQIPRTFWEILGRVLSFS